MIPRVLVTLPAAFLRLYAVGSLLSILLLILLLVFTILTIAVPRSSGVLNVVAALGLIVVQLAFIRGLLAAARAITNHRRWGYLVGLAMTAPSAVASVTLVVGYPEFMARPWAPLVAWSLITYYGILALLSLAGLASSFVRRDVPVARD